jgi:phosphatidate phosphatase APP1
MNSGTYAGSSIAIISDFDDTIKRSNIPNHGQRMIGNSVLFQKLYIDMPVLLREMQSDSEGLYIISASPKIIKPLIKASLKKSDLIYADIFTRGYCDLFTSWPCKMPRNPSSPDVKIRYKISKIESVLNSQNTNGLILLGDNVEADHVVYGLVAKRNPGKVKDIYIRKVEEEALPAGIKGFYTAFGIAVNEYQSGRMNYQQVFAVANTILDTPEDEMYRIIAYYGTCPTELNKYAKSTRAGIEELEIQVKAKLITYCQNRKSKS